MKNVNLLGRGFRMFSLFLCAFIFSSSTMFAQYDFICATEEDGFGNPSNVYSYSTNSDDIANFDIKVFNIKFWQINAPDGSNPAPLSENMVLEAVANLNIEFNKYKIYFKYRGYGEFDSPSDVIQKVYDYSIPGCTTVTDQNGNPVIDPDGYGVLNRCQIGALMSDAANNGAYDPTAFNVYVPYECQQFGGGAYYSNTKSIIPTANILKSTFKHEVGHTFGLRHTFENYNAADNDPSKCYLVEHVTRDPNDPDFNADTRGDFVVDTNAVPKFSSEYCRENGLPTSACSTNSGFYAYYIDPIDCLYFGFGTDCLNEPYTIYLSDTKNFMNYGISTCSDQFTPGQGIRMQETIFEDSNGRFAQASTDISELYEPYKGEYYVAGPLPPQKPLFQPGFNYYFLECECDCVVPSDYNDISFSYTSNTVLFKGSNETDYSSITHPNHTAIAIKVENEPIFWPQPRKCFDNYNRSPSGGKVTKFNDNTFNSNVTITPKDSTAINNPNLISNLPQGLYAIDKDYLDGSTEQTIIVKENN
jgi:hypothetical protein